MPTLRRPSLVLVLTLFAALAFGAAASLLIGVATSPGAPPAPTTDVIIPGWVFGAGVAAAVALFAGVLIFNQLRQPSVAVPSRFVVTTLVAILLLIGFVVIGRTLGGGGIENTGAVTSPGQNATGVSENNTTANATLLHGGGSVPFFWWPSLPPWLPFVVLAAILLVVVVVALPLARRYVSDRQESRGRRRDDAQRAAEVKGALARAAEDLDRGGDPRAVIEALYATVLARLAPMVGSMEVETPEEIRTQHLVRLGIRREAATVLTRLFEEARYSSHPLAGDAADAARQAVREALADLARNPVPA